MENGKEKLFEWVQSMMLIFYIETGRKLIMKMLCRVESSDEFVTFEVRKTENTYGLYMILGYDGKMLLKEFTDDLEESKEYAEKIIDSMKHIS